MKTLYYISIVFLLASSCKKDDHAGCFVRTGDVTTESRSLANFTEIELYDNINLVLIQGTENTVEVEAGENLIYGIHTEIENGVLKITNDNTCNFTRSYKVPVNVYLTYTSLRELIHYGAGLVSTRDTLKQAFLEFQQWNSSGNFKVTVDIDTLKFGLHTGAGNVDAYGLVNELSLYSAGHSIFRCKEIVANTVYINQSSTGDFTVNVTNALYVQIYNYGNVYYYGSPTTLYEQIEGSGSIIHL